MSVVPLPKLLHGTDPDPVEVIYPFSVSPVLLICEHAGQHVPEALAQLGLTDDQMQQHVAWDIGAAAVTRILAARLKATAVLQRYSRLVIDCNRPPEAPDSAAALADGISVPGNTDLSDAAHQLRVDEIFRPFHDRITQLLDTGRFQLVLSIHSYTPELGGVARPWEMAFLFRQDAATSVRLADLLAARHPVLRIGMNEPYQVQDESDWFVPQHGEHRGLPHSLIEVRNDEITTTAGQALWADRLAEVVNIYLEETQDEAHA